MAKKTVKQIRFKSAGSGKKPRRKPGELEKCYDCPPEHPGWLHSRLRNRARLPRCPEHREGYDETHRPWPKCPNCGNETEFGPRFWKGSIEKCIAVCDECDFQTKAVEHFDRLLIKVIASPIVKPEDAPLLILLTPKPVPVPDKVIRGSSSLGVDEEVAFAKEQGIPVEPEGDDEPVVADWRAKLHAS